MENKAHIPVKQWALPLFLVLVCVGLYLPGITHPFVYDDHGQLEENAYLQNKSHILDVLLLRTLDDEHVLNGRRPWLLLSQMLDYRLWRARVWGYRMVNLLYHAGCVLLLYLLVLRLSRDSLRPAGYAWFAFVSALLFGCHPVLTESVHAPAFRADVMYSFFVLLYVLLGIAWGKTTCLWRRAWLGALMLLTLLLAIGSKEAGVIAPCCLLLLWWLFPVVRPSRRAQLLMGGCSLIVVGLFILGCAGNATFQALNTSWNGLSLRYPTNLYTLPWLWVRYMATLLWPWPLIVDRVIVPVPTWWSLRCLAGGLTLAASILAVFMARRTVPWPGLAVGWMLLAFLPVANIIPLYNPMAERYMYFMTAGFGMLAGWVLTRPNKTCRWGLYARYGILGILLSCYVLLTLWRLEDWRDDETLWRRTLMDEPCSARAHTWLGVEYKAQQQIANASQMFEAAISLNPHDITALVNRAILFGEDGDLAQAEACLREAVMRRPDKPAAHWNLSVALQLQGRNDEALESARQAVALDPYYTPALRGLIVLLAAQGDYGEAIEVSERLLAIDPEDPAACSAVSFLRASPDGVPLTE
ncbi:MAG: tetratricopeptide repeat protein [Spartobacteria bacterium]|nr:tetratricopeptide repeat protein [Spartobacteria bacterium]